MLAARSRILAILLAASAAAVVWPVLGTPLSGDDAFNSYLEGWKLAHHASLLDTFKTEFIEWDVGRGRFIPILQMINVLQFHFFQQAPPLKFMQVAAIALDIVLLFAVVLEIDGLPSVAACSALVAVLGLQARSWYDAIAQYNLHLPIGTALALAALLFAARFRRRRSRSDYALALTCFAAAAVTYEIFVPLVLPLGYLLWLSATRSTARAWLLLPFGGVVVAEWAAVAIIRHLVPQPFGGPYSPNVFSSGYLPASFLQTTGALPFDYILTDPQSIFRNHAGWWYQLTVPGAFAAVAGAAAVACALVFRTDAGPDRKGTSSLVLSGLALALGPALLVASSPFYQQLIKPGLPYIPVYAQGFGIALLAAPALRRLLDVRGRLLAGALVLAAALGCGLLCTANELAMKGFSVWGFPRDTLVLGLARAKVALPAPGALVFLDDSYIVNDRFERNSLWNNVWFYRLFGGRVWQTQPITAEGTLHFDDATELRTVDNTAEHGAFLLQQIHRTSDARISIRYAAIVERTDDPGTRPILVGSAFRSADFGMTGNGNGWASYRFTPRCAGLPTSAIVDNSPSLAAIEYGSGFSVTEQDSGGRPYRWAGPLSYLILRNSSATPIDTRLVASVQTAGRAHGILSVMRSGAKLADIPLSSTQAALIATNHIPARGSVVLELRANAPNVAFPGDTRDVRVKLSGVSIADAAGCAAPDAAPR